MGPMMVAGLVWGCSGPAARPVEQLRQITASERFECRSLGMIVKRGVGSTATSINTDRAMELALEAVLEANGDSYYLLDVDTDGRGSRVVMQAYDCD